MQPDLVKQVDGLVAKTAGQRRDPQRIATGGATRREKRARRAGFVIEPVENGDAVDQRHAVVEDQRRHAAQRIHRTQPPGIAEHRPGPVFIIEPIEPQRNRHPPHKRRIILADQDHAPPPAVPPEADKTDT
jgi:hypothetical protein